MTTNQLVNKLLGNQRIPKYEFDDLKIVIEACERTNNLKLLKIFDWFRFLQAKEIVGWRPKPITKKIVKLLKRNSQKEPLTLYALFCPSYKKGKGVSGFRTDDVGSTTLSGIKNLEEFYQKTKKLKFNVKKPLAIFFDLAIERYSKILEEKTLEEGLKNLNKNIENFKKYLPKHFEFMKLSDFLYLKNKIGYSGIKFNKLPIPEKTLKRIFERGMKFYKLFGWSKKMVLDRSITIACSEALVGNFLRKTLPNSIMIYTPTMLERGAVYSGMRFETDPLPTIFPRKEGL